METGMDSGRPSREWSAEDSALQGQSPRPPRLKMKEKLRTDSDATFINEQAPARTRQSTARGLPASYLSHDFTGTDFIASTTYGTEPSSSSGISSVSLSVLWSPQKNAGGQGMHDHIYSSSGGENDRDEEEYYSDMKRSTRNSLAIPQGTHFPTDSSRLHNLSRPTSLKSIPISTVRRRQQQSQHKRQQLNVGTTAVLLRDTWRTFLSSSTSSHRLLYAIGFFAIFFMCIMLSSAISLIKYANVGFLKFAYDRVASIDLIIELASEKSTLNTISSQNVISSNDIELHLPFNFVANTTTTTTTTKSMGKDLTRKRRHRSIPNVFTKSKTINTQQANTSDAFYFFNFAQIQKNIETNTAKLDCKCAPRIYLSASWQNTQYLNDARFDAPIIFMNIQREQDINIGYAFKTTFETILPLGSDQILLHQDLAQQLFNDTNELIVGQSKVRMYLNDGNDLITAMRTMTSPTSVNLPKQRRDLLWYDYTVVGVIPVSNLGKFSIDVRLFAVLDVASLYQRILGVQSNTSTLQQQSHFDFTDESLQHTSPNRIHLQSNRSNEQISSSLPHITINQPIDSFQISYIPLATHIMFRIPELTWYTSTSYQLAAERIQLWAQQMIMFMGIKYPLELLPPLVPDKFTSPTTLFTDQTTNTIISFNKRDTMSTLADTVIYNYPGIKVSLPVLSQLKSTELPMHYLNFVIVLLVVVMSSVAGWMCSAVLEVTANSKRPMIAGWRMLGGGRAGATGMILLQALFLSVPATILGIIASEFIYLKIRSLLNIPDFNLSPLLTPTSIIIAVVLSICVPVVASLHPVRTLLFANSTTLRANEHEQNHQPSLVKHRTSIWSSSSDGTVNRSSLLEASLETQLVWRALAGLFISVYCGIIYYLLPQSLVSGDFSLMFSVNLLVLLLTLLALAFLLCCVGQIIFETFVHFLIFNLILPIFGMFWSICLIVGRCIVSPQSNRETRLNSDGQVTDANKSTSWSSTTYRLENLSKNHLRLHRHSNRKTELLFSICLAFMIAFTMIVNTEIKTYALDLERRVPSDIKVITSNRDSNNDPVGLPLTEIETLIAQRREQGWDIQYGYHSWSLSSYFNRRGTQLAITNMGKISLYTHSVYGISPGLLDLLEPTELFQIHSSKSSPNAPQSVSDALMNARMLSISDVQPRYHGAITSSFFMRKEEMSLDINIPYLLKMVMSSTSDQSSTGSSISGSNTTVFFPLQGVAFLDSIPLFPISKYGQDTAQASLVSFDTLALMLSDIVNGGTSSGDDRVIVSPSVIAVQAVYINTSPAEQGKKLVDDIKTILASHSVSADVLEASTERANIKTAQNTSNAVFVVMMALPIVLGGVSLSLGMSINVAAMRREISIIRVCGLTGVDLARLLVCEGVVVTITGMLIGTAVGIILGWLVGAQRSLFVHTDIPFSFPGQLFGILLGVNIVIGMVASLLPAIQVIRTKTHSLR